MDNNTEQNNTQFANAPEAIKTDEAEGASAKKKKKKEPVPEKRFRDMTKKEKILDILSFLRDFVILAAIFFILNKFVFMLAVIPSGSMMNTLLVDDKVFANRLAVTFGTLERGDIIIFNFHEKDKDEYLIKRLIGLPGDEVKLEKGKIYINGSDTPLDEPYVTRGWKYSMGGSKDRGTYIYNVPEDSYFFMGDNRDASGDSREWKNPFIPKEDLEARAVFIYMPFSRIGSLSN